MDVDVSHADPRFAPAGGVAAMTVSTRQGRQAIDMAATDRREDLFNSASPWRHMTFGTRQPSRSGLEWLASTGRHHAFESLQERRLLQVLDFDGDVQNVLSQPLLLSHSDGSRSREHIPDYLVRTSERTLLINVKPAERITDDHRRQFAAADALAAARGWDHAVVCDWKQPACSTIDALLPTRRPQPDVLGLLPLLLAQLRCGPQPLGRLVGGSQAPPVARTLLLGALWRRTVTVDLTRPLGDHSVIGLP